MEKYTAEVEFIRITSESFKGSVQGKKFMELGHQGAASFRKVYTDNSVSSKRLL